MPIADHSHHTACSTNG